MMSNNTVPGHNSDYSATDFVVRLMEQTAGVYDANGTEPIRLTEYLARAPYIGDDRGESRGFWYPLRDGTIYFTTPPRIEDCTQIPYCYPDWHFVEMYSTLGNYTIRVTRTRSLPPVGTPFPLPTPPPDDDDVNEMDNVTTFRELLIEERIPAKLTSSIEGYIDYNSDRDRFYLVPDPAVNQQCDFSVKSSPRAEVVGVDNNGDGDYDDSGDIMPVSTIIGARSPRLRLYSVDDSGEVTSLSGTRSSMTWKRVDYYFLVTASSPGRYEISSTNCLGGSDSSARLLADDDFAPDSRIAEAWEPGNVCDGHNNCGRRAERFGTMRIGSSVSGRLNYSGDEDFFLVQLRADREYEAKATSSETFWTHTDSKDAKAKVATCVDSSDRGFREDGDKFYRECRHNYS